MPQSPRAKNALLAATFAVIAVLVAWLAIGRSSPLSLPPEAEITLHNFIADFGLPAIVLSIAVTRNVHDYYGPVFFVGLFAEAFVVAYLVLLIFARVRRAA